MEILTTAIMITIDMIRMLNLMVTTFNEHTKLCMASILRFMQFPLLYENQTNRLLTPTDIRQFSPFS